MLAAGAGGGSRYYRQNGGNGAKATVFFCVASGETTVSYDIGAGGSATGDQCAGAGSATTFIITGNLDKKFSGIYSGTEVTVGGGTGGCYYDNQDGGHKGTVSGLAECSLARHLPTQYYYSKSGYGLDAGDTEFGSKCNGALSGICEGCEKNGASSNIQTNYYTAPGKNGYIQIDTIIPQVALN